MEMCQSFPSSCSSGYHPFLCLYHGGLRSRPYYRLSHQPGLPPEIPVSGSAIRQARRRLRDSCFMAVCSCRRPNSRTDARCPPQRVACRALRIQENIHGIPCCALRLHLHRLLRTVSRHVLGRSSPLWSTMGCLPDSHHKLCIGCLPDSYQSICYRLE